ncbi:MAG: PAS domain S-box protein [Alphaproteobacteria bacterium]|nr:PAS domain S-box protein [Alphaproteobacteria bacterium]
MRTLRISHRLCISTTAFIALIAILAYYFVESVQRNVTFALQEKHGIAYQRPLTRILAKLAKREALGSSTAQEAEEVEQHFNALKKLHALTNAPWRFDTKKLSLSELEQSWTVVSPSGDKARDTIAGIRSMITQVGNISNLILDPELPSYYLADMTLRALPQTLDRLGLIGGEVRGMLAKGDALSAQEKTRLAILAEVFQETAVNRTMRNVDTLQQEGMPHISDPSSAYRRTNEALVTALREMVQSPGKMTQAAWDESVRDALEDTLTLWVASTDALERLLDARILRYEQHTRLVLTSVIVGLLASIVFFAMVVCSMSIPLSEVQNAMLHLAKGNLQQPVPHLGKGDEIGDMANALQVFKETAIEKDARTREIAKANHELAHSRSFLKNIIDSVADPIFVKDRQNRLIAGNKAFWELIGRQEKDLLFKDGFDLFPREEADLFRKMDEEAFNNPGKVCVNAEKMTDSSGMVHILSTKKVCVQGADGEPLLVGVVRDNTEREKLIEQLTIVNEQLEQFAHVASHDLRESIRMVVSFTDLLQEEYRHKLDDVGKEYTHTIRQSAKKIEAMVADMFDYARLERNPTEGLEEIDTNQCLKDAVHIFKEAINSTNAKIDAQALPTVIAHPIRFTRLMQNLIGNALKYQKKGNTPKLRISAEDKGDHWRFAVADNGIGIKEDYLETVFAPFKRLHSTHEYAGTGIGLAICKKIVEGFGGMIWVESEFGKGSTFFFTIPKR